MEFFLHALSAVTYKLKNFNTQYETNLLIYSFTELKFKNIIENLKNWATAADIHTS